LVVSPYLLRGYFYKEKNGKTYQVDIRRRGLRIIRLSPGITKTGGKGKKEKDIEKLIMEKKKKRKQIDSEGKRN